MLSFGWDVRIRRSIHSAPEAMDGSEGVIRKIAIILAGLPTPTRLTPTGLEPVRYRIFASAKSLP